MRIIKKVEINYFRSIYSLTLSPCKDLNILVGGNDAGKSNILKALNLFFNNYTEIYDPYDFLLDLSKLREVEARSAKGRATIWMKITFNNYNKWDSLPEEITVKRTWNRYQTEPQTEFYPRDISPTATARFLNRIKFNYIPATKSPEIFSHYLRTLHDALIDGQRFGDVKEASGELSKQISHATAEMSSKILDDIGLESSIAVPQDLKELFSALNFITQFGEHEVPLQFRGDGIKMRHIPFILDFLSRNTNKDYIWAYEEPENSLEMRRVFELGEQFKEDFSRGNQIFVTTHSPAFYDLKGSQIGKWQVTSETVGPRSQLVTTVNQVSDEQILDESLGIAAMVAPRAREAYEHNKKLEQELKALEQKVSHATKPILVVEGETDKKIIEVAYKKLYGDTPLYKIVATSGADEVVQFVIIRSSAKEEDIPPIIGLVDNDQAGRKALSNNCKKYKEHPEVEDFRIINTLNHFYVGLMPVAEEFVEVKEALKGNGGIYLPIEFMFSKELIDRAIEEEKLHLKDREVQSRDASLFCDINLSDKIAEILPDGYKYFAKEVDDNSKKDFAQWVAYLEPSEFENFKTLFTALTKLSSES